MGNSASRIECDSDTAEPSSSVSEPPVPAPPANKPPIELPVVTLTEFAKRYGASNAKVHKGTGKSGITPLSPPADLTTLSTQERLLWREYDLYQRQVLRGFTTWELMDSGTITKADVNIDGLLGSSIHTFYRRDRWQTRDVISIGEGIEGIHEASNEIVWRALLPAIQLASLVWTSRRQLLWLDTILNGQRIKVPDEEIKDGGPNTILYSLHARNPERINYDFATSSGFVEYMAERLNFSIFDGTVSELLSDPPAHGVTNHRRNKNNGYKSSHIRLSWQDIIILLRRSTTAAERLVQQFVVANTLVHEVTHAIEAFAIDMHQKNGVYVPFKKGDRATEPFYEDEEMAEMGRANEKFLWGGNIGPLVARFNSTRDRIRPPLALRRSNWPNWRDHFKDGVIRRPGTRRFRRPDNFRAGSVRLMWTVPISWVEQIQSKDFWAVAVTKFGSHLTPPAIMGRMDFKQDDKYDPKLQLNLHTLVIGSAHREWIKSSNDAGMRTVHLPDGPFANAAEEDQWLAEYDLKMGAIAVNVAANLQHRLKRSWSKKDDGAGAYRVAKEAQLPYLGAKDTKYGKERAQKRASGTASGRGVSRGRGARGSARGSAQGGSRGNSRGNTRGT